MYRGVKCLTKSAIFLSLLKWFGEGGGGGTRKLLLERGRLEIIQKRGPWGD